MSLKQKTVSSVGWNATGSIGRQLLQTVTMLVMALYLAPQDFGLFAIVSIFVNLAQLLGNMGTAQVVIHLDEPPPRLLSSLFYLNVGLGALLCALLFLVSWPLSRIYSEPELAVLLQSLSVCFVFSGIGNVQRALMEKSMRFRQIVVLEFASMGAACAVGIGAAASGQGVQSLVGMSIVGAATLNLGLAVTCGWRPRWEFAREDIRQVWGYTSHLTAFDIVNFLARNADAFLIGKFIGAGPLGLYSLAYRVMLYPLDNVSRVVIRVLFPAFSRLKHENERFRNAYLQAICGIGMLTFPAMAGLIATADNLVAVAFDPRWAGLSTLIMLLAPVGMIQSITSSVGSIFNAKGSTRGLLALGAFNSAMTVVAFAAGIPFGVEGVAAFYALATLALTYPTLKISWAQIDLSVAAGLRALAPYFFAASAMAVLVWGTGQWLVALGSPLPSVLAMQVGAGIVIYGSYLYLAQGEALAGLLRDVRQP